jgi:hypothetical protein
LGGSITADGVLATSDRNDSTQNHSMSLDSLDSDALPRMPQIQAGDYAAMVSLYFVCYNFARVHQTLRVTPAMEAGISKHVWTIDEIVGLLG